MSELTVYRVYADEDEDYAWITAHKQDPNGLWVFASSAQEAIASLEAKNADLLAALENMVKWCGKRGGDDDALLPANQQDQEVAQAMQAIAKAKGEKV